MLSYKLISQDDRLLEFRLKAVSLDLVRFMIKHHKVYITSKGVVIQVLGKRIILEEDEGPSGIPVGITLPEMVRLVRENDPPLIEYSAVRSFKSPEDLEQYCVLLVEALAELSKAARNEALERNGLAPLSGNPFLIVLD